MTDNNEDLTFPAFLVLETVRGCNARCPFCPIGTGQINQTGHMADSLYAKIEREIIAYRDQVRRVTLNTFGEPMLDRNLEERVRRLKTAGIRETALATNAMLLTRDRAEGLLRAGLDILRMSISTINPDKYGRIRRGLNLTTVLDNARGCFELRDRLGAEAHFQVSMEKSELIDEDDVRQWKDHWLGLIRVGDMLKVDVCFDLVKEDRTAMAGLKSKPCRPLLQTMNIAFSGHVPLCCADFKTEDSPYLLGRVTENSIQEIWNGSKAKNYRRLHRRGLRDEIMLCRGCDIWDTDVKENISI